jgi:ketosteroid isomerase-like protein
MRTRFLAAPVLSTALILAPLAVATVGSSTACAESRPTSSASQTEEQQVLAADDEYVAAEVKHDEPTMRRLVDDRFVYNAADGTTSDKEEFLRYALGMPMIGQALRERSVVMEGGVAFVFATTDIKLAPPGKAEYVSSYRYTCAYVKRQGQWRMLVLQMQKRTA